MVQAMSFELICEAMSCPVSVLCFFFYCAACLVLFGVVWCGTVPFANYISLGGRGGKEFRLGKVYVGKKDVFFADERFPWQ